MLNFNLNISEMMAVMHFYVDVQDLKKQGVLESEIFEVILCTNDDYWLTFKNTGIN